MNNNRLTVPSTCMPYRGPFQAIWDLSTPALKRIVAYGPKHLQFEAATKELKRREV